MNSSGGGNSDDYLKKSFFEPLSKIEMDLTILKDKCQRKPKKKKNLIDVFFIDQDHELLLSCFISSIIE